MLVLLVRTVCYSREKHEEIKIKPKHNVFAMTMYVNKQIFDVITSLSLNHSLKLSSYDILAMTAHIFFFFLSRSLLLSNSSTLFNSFHTENVRKFHVRVFVCYFKVSFCFEWFKTHFCIKHRECGIRVYAN